MPRIRISAPPPEAVQSAAREYALLHQIDPEQEGVDSEKLLKYAGRGDEAKVKSLASKTEASFEDFAAAFSKKGEAAKGEGNCLAMSCPAESAPLEPTMIKRRELRADDVQIQLTYCGLCHSDVHQVRNDWGGSKYPMVPGHEMLGVVTSVGSDVTKFKVGDLAAVGCMVDSCGSCRECERNEEQFCKGSVFTYNSTGKDGEKMMGGYSTFIIVRDAFALTLARNLHLPGTAPLLCAGITVYSPMKHYDAAKPGMRIAVAGLGGLGHMAVKFGKAFGQHVTVLSRSDAKKDDAMKSLGADAYLVTKDEEAVKEAAESFDAIIDTISANHDIPQLLSMLAVDGKLLCVGVAPEPYSISAAGFVMRRRMIAGSLIGGIKETQEMLDFCASKGISADVEVIGASQINESYDRIVDGDVKYRFVIDTLNSMIQE